MKISELLKILEDNHIKYGTSKPYLCGGLPRDKYLGKLSSISDIDITTGDKSIKELSIKTYNKLNEKFNIKYDQKSDGHTTIYFKNIKIDFSSNFIDPVAKKVLVARNIKPTPLLLEVFSRDFTCNSMLAPVDFSEIIDLVGTGKKDCDNKIIKTILPPEATFRSNTVDGGNTRIIRSIYLASKLNFSIDNSIVEYVRSNPQLLTLTNPKTLSKKLNLSYKIDPEKTKYYMSKMNLWKFVPINEMLSDEILDLLTNPKESLY